MLCKKEIREEAGRTQEIQVICIEKKVENISPRAASALGFSCL